VADHGGFLYDSDYYGDDLPFWTEVQKTDGSRVPHLVVPYTLDTNDMRFALPQGFSHGDEFFEYLRDAFDVMYAEGDERPAMLSVGMHCRLLGRPGRFRALQRFLDHIESTTGCGCAVGWTSPVTGSPDTPALPRPDREHKEISHGQPYSRRPRFCAPRRPARLGPAFGRPRQSAPWRPALFASDDFFAEVARMLNPEPAQFVPGKFDTNGKWMDGWESRRKRVAGHDWALVKLGVKGVIRGFDVDTSHFTGNYPPAVSIEATVSASDDVEALRALAGPRSCPPPPSAPAATTSSNAPARGLDPPAGEHLPRWRHRPLRVYGRPVGSLEAPARRVIDLVAMENGGRAVSWNDASFGSSVAALMLPGRGQNMGDGWETRRRREPGNDWCVLELGAPGTSKDRGGHRLLQGQLPRPLLAPGRVCDGRHRPFHHHPVHVLADPAARAEAADGRGAASATRSPGSARSPTCASTSSPTAACRACACGAR
jgi:hypothetical protein